MALSVEEFIRRWFKDENEFTRFEMKADLEEMLKEAGKPDTLKIMRQWGADV